MKFLVVGHAGSNDPTQAGLPFVFAKGALEGGHQVEIALANEATYLLKEVIAKDVKGVGWPPVDELIRDVVAAGASLHV